MLTHVSFFLYLFLTYLLPYLSFHLRIDPLRFEAEMNMWRVGLICHFMCLNCSNIYHRGPVGWDSLRWLSCTHTRLAALCPGLPRWAGTRMVKPIWILLKLETASDSGISWARCKSAPRSRQITTPAPHHSVFYRPDALPATKPTASKHRRHKIAIMRSGLIG